MRCGLFSDTSDSYFRSERLVGVGMNDLLVAFGLVLVIEGLIWAVAPDVGRRLLEVASHTPNRSLQIAGWTAVAVGLGLVWLLRG